MSRISTPTALLSLLGLVVQNTATIILLKISFRPSAESYATSTVVFLSELAKLITCSVLVGCRSQKDLVATITSMSTQRLLFLPSALYVLQNNLLLFGARRLSPLVYLICTQTKVLTTAALSRIVLGVRLSRLQFVSLLLLTVGVICVQREAIHEQNPVLTEETFSGVLPGLFAVLSAALTSATAGTILEKIYKSSSPERDRVVHDVWTRNLQLSLISVPFSVIGIASQDKSIVFKGKFLVGYDGIVWCIVGMQTAGGIIIGFVMKYASNILKCLAVAISVCFCALYSIATDEMAMSTSTFIGIFAVVAAVFMYSLSPPDGFVPDVQEPFKSKSRRQTGEEN